MGMLRVFQFVAVLGATCLTIAGDAAASESKIVSASADSLNAPLSLRQALSLSDLQPRIQFDSPASKGERQTNSIIHGDWQYEIAYVRAGDNWRFDSYTVSRVSALQSSGDERVPGKSSAAGAKPLVFGAIGGGDDQLPDGPLPPGPETNPYRPMNPPPNPGDKQTSQHTVCGFEGGSYNLHVVYTWVPEHEVKNEDGSTTVVPGQWVLTTYEISIGAGGCK